MAEFHLTAANERLLQAAAVAEAWGAWRGEESSPRNFHASLIRAAVETAAEYPPSAIDRFNDLTIPSNRFNAIRLFARSADAIGIDRREVVTDVEATFREFLRRVWFSGELAPIFEGMRISAQRYRFGELALNNIIISGARVYPSLWRLISKRCTYRWRALDRLRASDFELTNVVIDDVPMRFARMRRGIMKRCRLSGLDCTSSVLTDVRIIEGSTMEGMIFDYARLIRFSIALDEEESSPEKGMGLTIDGSTDIPLEVLGAEEIGFDDLKIDAMEILPSSDGDASTDEIPEWGLAPTLDLPDGTADTERIDMEAAIRTTDVEMAVLEEEVRLELGETSATHIRHPADPDITHQPDATTDEIDMTPYLEEMLSEMQSGRRARTLEKPPPLASPTVPEMKNPFTRITDSSFFRTSAEGADFSFSVQERNRFTYARLKGSHFDCSYLTDMDFSGSDLTDATFHSTVFNGRITFSRDTKITLEQLMQAKDARTAIAEYHRVFGSGGDRPGPGNRWQYRIDHPPTSYVRNVPRYTPHPPSFGMAACLGMWNGMLVPKCLSV